MKITVQSATGMCSSCGAPIFWSPTAKTGKPMPIDSVPVDGGNVEVRKGLAFVVAGEPGTCRYVSHFATCPAAAKHRKAPVRQ